MLWIQGLLKGYTYTPMPSFQICTSLKLSCNVKGYCQQVLQTHQLFHRTHFCAFHTLPYMLENVYSAEIELVVHWAELIIICGDFRYTPLC